MSDIITERVCAEPEGDIVVFLIGMRINRLTRPWRWFPVASAMPRMLRELNARPALGLLAARGHFGVRNLMVLQYWKSAEHLRAYAHASDKAHLPAWQAFNRAIGTNGDVGIWHETYVVPAGHAESMYVNMPPYGLGLAAKLFPAKGARATAAKRLSRIAVAASEPG
ncbi:DUF4188 domain-containing protein [Lichenicoccus sp.]|uniref:DUF4188 domain-containing protein n=1 Tax=Lichenicoccus sp. TaxID=2781899 RepID=UPI003D0F9C43